jgi:predicted Zn-dependent peptidase
MDEVINNVEAVTEKDILELAESLFQDNRFALTLLGPVTDKHVFDDILP